MAKFINPFTDVGFKIIFGQEMTKGLLIDFLNDLLVGERHIQDITFLDKELQPEFQGDRGVIYDIYCTTLSLSLLSPPADWLRANVQTVPPHLLP